MLGTSVLSGGRHDAKRRTRTRRCERRCKLVIYREEVVKADLAGAADRPISSPMSFLRPASTRLMALVEEAGRNVQRCGLLLHDLLSELPRARDAGPGPEGVRAGRRSHHPRHHPPPGRRGRVRAPFDAGDGYALATALDDIVDHSEQVAAQLGLYGVEAPMEQAVEFTEVLVGAGEQIAQALRCLRTAPSSAAPGRDPPPGERGRPPAARRRRLAVRGRHRPDGRDPLEGHLRVARGGRGRVRDGRARARGDHAQAAGAGIARARRCPSSCDGCEPGQS
jgi:hypothetical protein